ncbi:MAG TPA: SDR family oxidoreductase [Chitinophaga sp.]|uniref:SDR family oxidoreductase n=1 Tax=Chitinophaga sp. TaxID=1869181 RepID=UPI002C34C91A|nr:SDR family oxidoreductase [Chitinophaga sp.]HVI46698.1 SDR family oxidoreductase [Chitinophaga sp.]
MILVTGATGHLGNDVVHHLLKKIPASEIAALARDTTRLTALKEKGVEIRPGDYNDYDSLVKAFSGIDKLYFVASNDIPNRMQQHINVVNAAKEANVKHVVFTSFQRRRDSGTPIAFISDVYLETESRLKQSGITYTLMKHGLYADVLPFFLGDSIPEDGIFTLPAGDGKVSFALRSDMGEAGAHVLTTTGHDNKTYEISGNTAFSIADVASILSGLAGREIRYVSPTPEAFRQQRIQAGLPPEIAAMVTSFGEAINEREFDFPDTTLETFLGRKPTPLKDYLKTVYGL